jgi:cobalt-zinc-cadmium efflux system protein
MNQTHPGTLKDNGHNHSHNHAPKSFSKAFAIGVSLNLGFVLLEGFYGYISNSLALVADAGHNFSDVVGLLLAWAAAWLSTRKPSSRFTYGFGKTSILAALANALLLLVAVGAIIWEAFSRINNPENISGNTMIAVASIGIIINGGTALLFMSGRKSDLNIRGAYLHMATDALVSVGVVITGVLIGLTGWLWLDSSVSIVIGLVILFGTWGLLRDSVNLAIAAVPHGIDVNQLREFLCGINGVKSIHDLHVWAMSTTETALTVHLVMPQGHPGDGFLKDISHQLEHKFEVHHSTFQIEIGDLGGGCHLESDDVV